MPSKLDHAWNFNVTPRPDTLGSCREVREMEIEKCLGHQYMKVFGMDNGVRSLDGSFPCSRKPQGGASSPGSTGGLDTPLDNALLTQGEGLQGKRQKFLHFPRIP
jgi:hypothetical protein